MPLKRIPVSNIKLFSECLQYFDDLFPWLSSYLYKKLYLAMLHLISPLIFLEKYPTIMVILLIWQAEELDDIQRMRNTPDFFPKLVDSIAPTVFGHQDIKRAILLMLLGGVHKFTHEGINLRGDINVCIVGDPSCAKSQFLKYATISGFYQFNYHVLYKPLTYAGI